MLAKYIEEQLIEAAIEAFRKNLPGQVFVEKPENKLQLNNTNYPDRLIIFKIQNKEITYFLEVKNNITTPAIGNLLLNKNKLPHPLLLITNHVTDFLADNLKRKNIEFIDTAGNGFINQKFLYIFVKGNTPPDIFKHIPKNQAFKPTGLKIIFAFLYNPELINKTYREIALQADVALGTVGWVMKDLTKLGYLVKIKGKQRKLLQKEKLFDRWKTEYAERLHPKLLLGRFTGTIDGLPLDLQKNKNILWGGETAAEKITNFLKPQITTIYAKKEQLNEILLKLRLKKDIDGTIEIYDYFWTPKENDNEETVPPILVYADLAATGEQRNIEVAGEIFKKYVIEYLKEN